MAITVAWASKVINIPKADTALIQSSPTEIRELDLDTFRQALKALEAGEEGMAFVDTHSHNPPVTVGGVTLARVVEIINGYTITFEDGQYAVNLVNANSNVGDRVNVNQVSIRSANSAGLVQTQEIEHASFNGAVWIDVVNGTSGTTYPIGTQGKPVNNVADANLIDTVRAFRRYNIVGDITLTTGDTVDGVEFYGASKTKTTITVDAAASVVGCGFHSCTATGTLDGGSTVDSCIVGDLSYVDGEIRDSELTGTVTLSGAAQANIINCSDGNAGTDQPIIDMGGSGSSLTVRGFNGAMSIRNKTGADFISIDLNSGVVTLEGTCIAGSAVVRGVGKLEDSSGVGLAVNADNLVRGGDLNTVYLRLGEVWKRLGLDASDPFSYDHVAKRFKSESGDIVIDISGDGADFATETRQA